ncbi:MAG: GGDEF domain-containing protein [Casimicrobiaceae bacterium]
MPQPASRSLGFYRLLASFPLLAGYRAKFAAVVVVAFTLPLAVAWVTITLGVGRVSVLALLMVFSFVCVAGCALAIWGISRLLVPLDCALDVLVAYVDGDPPPRVDAQGTDAAAQIVRGLISLSSRARTHDDTRRKDSERDSLTGLWGRMAGRKQAKAYMEDAFRRGRSVRVLVADIDRFAELNAEQGMVACDLVLKTYGTRLAKGAGDDSIAIRWDGDRFLVVQSAPDADFSAIDDVVARAIVVRGQGSPVMLSIGAAQSSDSLSFDELLGRAEAALRVERNGGSSHGDTQ